MKHFRERDLREMEGRTKKPVPNYSVSQYIRKQAECLKGVNASGQDRTGKRN